MCAYSLFGRCRVRPDLEVSREGEDFASTTLMHDSEIRMDFCTILVSKERYTHRPVGCQVVGSEAEGRKSEAVIDVRQSGLPCGKRNLLDAYHNLLQLFSVQP